MSDLDDEDLGKFLAEEDDDIKPIDMNPPAKPKKPGAPPRPGNRRPPLPGQEEQPPLPEGSSPQPPPLEAAEAAPEGQSLDDGYDAFLNGPKRDKPLGADLERELEHAPAGLDHQERDQRRNQIKSGEYCDILDKDPTLKRILIATGWDQRALDADPVDVDLVAFLLNKNDQTRVDEDFVFYNNPVGCDNAIKHLGDSRTGAGDGDDEVIFVDLNGLPYDIVKIMLVLAIYDEELKGHHFGMVKNVFIRVLNKDDKHEIVRFPIPDDDMAGNDVVYAAVLIREGPKWIFEAHGKLGDIGLANVAKGYGMVIRELQSTGVTGTEEEQKAVEEDTRFS